jgi:diguanylate cyclase (GGDEF)-like protein/PAS domain S-box-containing protein
MPTADGSLVTTEDRRRVTQPAALDDSGTRRWLESLTHGGERVVIARDLHRRTAFVSTNAERLTGWAGHDLSDRIYALAHPEDQALLFDASRAIRAGGEPGRRFPVRFSDPDGWFREFEAELTNRLDDPDFPCILVVLHPTRRAFDRANRWAGLLATSAEMVIIQRHDLRTGYVSPNVEAILGVTADRFVSRWTEVLHPDDAPAVTEALAEAADAPGSERAMRVRASHADGTLRTFDVTIVNHLGDGMIDGIVIRARDVTEQAAAEHRMHRLLRDSSGAACVLDTEGKVTWTTPGVDRFIGEHRMLTPEVVEEIFSAHGGEDVIECFDDVVARGPGAHRRIVGLVGPGGAKRWVDVTLTNATDDPALGGVIVNIRDVDEAVRAGETGHRLTQVLESTTDMVCIFDRDFSLVWANAAAVEVIGREAIAERAVRDRLPPWALTLLDREVLPSLQTHGTWRGELGIVSGDGDEIPIEVTVLTHRGATGVEFVSAIARDISRRKALEEQLHAKARHDPLTGLPNRTLLSERLELALQEGVPLAVLFLDLDQFKIVNDTQGHDAGDQLLVAAADRLQGALRPSDLVARFGGDEFVVLLPNVDDAAQAHDLATRVLEHLRGPIRIGPLEVFVTASAGIALSDGGDASSLISNADAAMYEAKANGRDQISLYTSVLRARTVERLETAHELRMALDADELDVWFQPIIDTVSGLPISLEALARWIRPDGTLVATDHFIQVAEDTGLIVPLGAAIIRRACAAIRGMGSTAEPFSFSVNLSAHQLADPALIPTLRDAVERYGIRPRQLYCEVTESAVMGDVTHSVQVLDQIRSLGIGIAMDDFGTGYSSLAYLHRFPVDVLKIDREFVHGLSFEGEWDRSLASGIISLGHSLGLTVVAEGVETQEQADILAMLDCDAMQGYLFAAPAPVDRLEAIIDTLIPERTLPSRTSTRR